MDAAVEQYVHLLSTSEAQPFESLKQELAEYWQVLEPTFEWYAARETAGRVRIPARRSISAPDFDSEHRRPDRPFQRGATRRGKVVVQQTFRQYRRRLVIAIIMTSGLGFLLAWFSVRKILKLEGTAARHFEEINHARTELKQLSARLLEAQEEERRSISRELHDEVGQSLSGVLVEMANLSNIIRGTDQAEQKADEIKKLLEDSIGVVRNMSLLLRPSMLDDLGLVPALQWQAREASKRSALWVKVDAEDVSDDLGEEYKTCIYRVVQEALQISCNTPMRRT